ncbi:MAG TPA: rod shape-determining protein MreC [Candidatus Magasanikbacteria bacterium]|nr:rod shape-determining protein MreC [Candidatus Magasanikbacteria bacterium]
MRKSNWQKTTILIGGIILFLVFFNYLGWFDFGKKVLRQLFVPFIRQSGDFSVKIKDDYEFFQNREQFFNAYRAAQLSLQKKDENEAKLKLLEEENSELKKQLGFKDKTHYNVVLTKVIGNNLEGTEKTIIIDRGENEGIKVGDPAVVDEGVLVGKVIKTEKDISIIRLLSDNQSKVASTIINREKSLGVVEGGYGLSVKMNFIPRNEVVQIGDLVVTSGLEEDTPRGLLIGKVAAIENEAYQPFQQAILTPSADYNRFVYISIILTQ